MPRQQVLVVIVSDGRTKANPQTLQYLREIGYFIYYCSIFKAINLYEGVFDEDAMLITSAGVDVQMNLFEYTPILMHRKVKRSGDNVEVAIFIYLILHYQ